MAARTRGDFSGMLNREQSAAIFERARRTSAVQALAKQVPLPADGKAIPVVSGRLQANWVAEGAKKPVSNAGLTVVNMDPKKIAVIAVVSAEVVRSNPGGYMNEIQGEVGEAFGRAFDLAALYNYSGTGQGSTGPFATSIASGSLSVEIGTGTTMYDDFVSALNQLVTSGKRLTGFALDDRLEGLLLSAKDGDARPLWINSITGEGQIPFGDQGYQARRGTILGRPAYMSDGIYSGTTADVEGVAGDWTKVAWGVVGGIKYDVSDQASVTIDGTLTSLFEQNLVAVRAEAEYGFVCADPASFVRLLNAV